VADQEHAAVPGERVEPPRCDSPPDSCGGEAQRQKLWPRHDATLPRRQVGNGVIKGARVEFSSHTEH
jgi:hypothetical protein